MSKRHAPVGHFVSIRPSSFEKSSPSRRPRPPPTRSASSSVHPSYNVRNACGARLRVGSTAWTPPGSVSHCTCSTTARRPSGSSGVSSPASMTTRSTRGTKLVNLSADRHHECLELAPQRFRSHPRLDPLDRPDISRHEGDLDVVRGEEVRRRLGAGAENQRRIAGLQPRKDARHGTARVDPPVHRLPLRRPQRQVLLTPLGVRAKPEALDDEAIHLVHHQHLGQHELTLDGGLHFGDGLVAEPEQFLARHRVLEGLDPLHHEFLVLLLERRRGPAAALLSGLLEGQHGSTCTWTWLKPRSSRSLSSTASAISCAAVTF